jgi:signal transduction histidine kinase
VSTARALIRQLERLGAAALDLANERLPRVVGRLQRGEHVDVDAEMPKLEWGDDEIGQVGQAFTAVQRTAVLTAVEQAELRRGIRDIFLNLARRSQALLHRQLGLLDRMERRATDAEDLAELFRVDHLATRMRRNAENLIVLSGAIPGRAWRQPIHMVDVIRGALAEVENYTRVQLMPIEAASLAGRTVGDIVHLLAELIENALLFSPPQTSVCVGGAVVANGYAIEIEDRGLGMSAADRAVANENLRFPPEFRLSSTARLGLYVVATLAARHDVRVHLRESPYGGTTAIVLLPMKLITELPDTGAPVEAVEPAETTSGDDDAGARRAGFPVPPADQGEVVVGTHGDLARHRTADARRIEDDTVSLPEPVGPDRRRPAEPDPPLFERLLQGGPASALPRGVWTPPPQRPAPEPGRSTASTSTAPIAYTPGGLPVRQRPDGQTHGSEALAGAVLPSADAGVGPADHQPDAGVYRSARTPEDIRRMVAAHHSGARRGRSEAERAAGHHRPAQSGTDAREDKRGAD